MVLEPSSQTLRHGSEGLPDWSSWLATAPA